LVAKLEQLLRIICFLVYFFTIVSILILEYFIRPIYPKIDALFCGYFSRNCKLKPHEWLVSRWQLGVIKLFGIDLIVDTSECQLP